MSGGFAVALPAALVLCGLVAGFLFAFAVVVMPGLRSLDDAAYLRAFKVIDGVIQNGSPLFGLVWVGSVLATLAVLLLGFSAASGAERMLALGGAALYVAGVQAPTIFVNIPLNNRLQRLRIDEVDSATLHEERLLFERRWNRWNSVRTTLATGTVVLLLAAVL